MISGLRFRARVTRIRGIIVRVGVMAACIVFLGSPCTLRRPPPDTVRGFVSGNSN